VELVLLALLGGISGAAVNRAADDFTARYALQYRFYSPLRAPMVVVSGALGFAALWLRYGASSQLVLSALYTVVFLLVLVTDVEHRLIFNVVILPAALFAALASPFSQLGVARSLLGGAIAFVIVFAIYIFAELFARVRGLRIAGGAFGQGDVKLATFMGIVVGLPNVFFAILYTILLGGGGALLFLAYQLIAQRRLALTAAIPYGPFFCMAGWAVMVFQI